MRERITDYLNHYTDLCAKLPKWIGAFAIGSLFLVVAIMVAALVTGMLFLAFYLWGFTGLVAFGAMLLIYALGYTILD